MHANNLLVDLYERGLQYLTLADHVLNAWGQLAEALGGPAIS